MAEKGRRNEALIESADVDVTSAWETLDDGSSRRGRGGAGRLQLNLIHSNFKRANLVTIFVVYAKTQKEVAFDRNRDPGL